MVQRWDGELWNVEEKMGSCKIESTDDPFLPPFPIITKRLLCSNGPEMFWAAWMWDAINCVDYPNQPSRCRDFGLKYGQKKLLPFFRTETRSHVTCRLYKISIMPFENCPWIGLNSLIIQSWFRYRRCRSSFSSFRWRLVLRCRSSTWRRLSTRLRTSSSVKPMRRWDGLWFKARECRPAIGRVTEGPKFLTATTDITWTEAKIGVPSKWTSRMKK